MRGNIPCPPHLNRSTELTTNSFPVKGEGNCCYFRDFEDDDHVMKYLLDVICAVLVAMIAVLATQRPAVNLNLRPSVADQGQHPDAEKEGKEKGQGGIVKGVVAAKALKERNIFTADGNYTVSQAASKGPLPENPYTLIGVLQGEEKKAVFRDYTGSLVTLTVGKKLGDGSVITHIDKLSVELKKGQEKTELRIFDVKPPKPVTLKKP